MARGSNTARRSGTVIFRIQAYPVKVGETFKNYAWVTLDPALTGYVQECVAPVPTNKILGLALNGAGTGPGFNVSDSNVNLTMGVTTPQGAAITNGYVSVALADTETEFSARGYDGVTDPIVPTLAHIGQQYGLAKDASGNWYVDLSANGIANPCVVITDIRPDLNMNLFLFKVILGLQLADQ